MNSVQRPKQPTRMLGTICGNYMQPSPGGPIKSVLSAYGTARAGTVREAPSTCMKPCQNIPGGCTCWIPMFFGKCGVQPRPTRSDAFDPMDQEIIARLRKRVAAEGLDGIVAVSPENVTYVSGFVVPSQSLMRWRHAICIVTADGRIAMVAIDMEANTVKAHAGIDDLRVYREFTEDPMDKLAEALNYHTLAG